MLDSLTCPPRQFQASALHAKRSHWGDTVIQFGARRDLAQQLDGFRPLRPRRKRRSLLDGSTAADHQQQRTSAAKIATICLTFMVLINSAWAQTDRGIAANYRGDEGIERHPAVIFRETFEQGSIAELTTRWEQAQHVERMSFVSDVPSTSSGGQSLYISGGWADLYRRLLPGYQHLYARFYAKLDPSCSKVHHWVWLGGHQPSTTYPWPRAGIKPGGDERWSAGIEPYYSGDSPPWRWAFYNYWADMRIDLDGNYWGNLFDPAPVVPAERGRWLSIELMVKLNSPTTASNGEQAFWIDGVKGGHFGPGFPSGQWRKSNIFDQKTTGAPFAGFRWRRSEDLSINYIWLQHFVDTDPGCEAWLDDLVIATEYIGPMGTGTEPTADSGFAQVDLGVAAPDVVSPLEDGPPDSPETTRDAGRPSAASDAASTIGTSAAATKRATAEGGCALSSPSDSRRATATWLWATLLLCLLRPRGSRFTACASGHKGCPSRPVDTSAVPAARPATPV